MPWELFAQDCFEMQTSQSINFQVSRITGLTHQAWPPKIVFKQKNLLKNEILY
jgi:hypothetical protein